MSEAKEGPAAEFLIVEDNENIRKLYATLIKFQHSDRATLFAENGQKGLDICRSSEPALILADIKMPLMDGIEFHRRLKEASPHLAGRVAFISATFSDSHLDYMRENNCSYLKKPFETAAFSNLIDSMLLPKQ